MNKQYNIPTLPLPYDLETREVLKQLTRSHRKLAEMKGVALTIPNERILISTLTLQEAKDSSEVEKNGKSKLLYKHRADKSIFEFKDNVPMIESVSDTIHT